MSNRRNSPSDMLAVGGYFMLQLGASIIVALIGSLYYLLFRMPEGVSADVLMQSVNDFLAQAGLLMIAGSNVVILFVLFIIARVNKRGFLAHCRLKERPRSSAVVILCALAGFFANFWLSFVLNSGIVPQQMLDSYESAYTPLSAGALPLELVTLVILAPLAEEIIYRGIILGHLKNLVPTGAAIVLQGVLFGAMHGDPLWIAYACGLGCVIGLIRVRCESVWAGVVFHMVFNGASYIFTLFANAVQDSAVVQTAVFIVSGLAFLACMWKICTPSKLVKND